MALEMRGDRGPYYYKKVREGGKVRSLYCGSGQEAVRASAVEECKRIETASIRATRQKDFELEVSTFTELDRLLDELASIVETTIDAQYLAWGYHTHSRSWRRQAERKEGE
jgi:23S rRNA A1618 N6-methylase RlmF